MSLLSTFEGFFKYSKYFSYFDKIAQVAEDATDHDSTRDKAADVLEDIINLAVPLVSAANPGLAAEVAIVVPLINAELDKLKDKPVVVTPPTPAPPQPPAPPVVPPTGPAYDTPQTPGGGASASSVTSNDVLLKSLGYVAGDYKYDNATDTQYMISKANLGVAGWTVVGQIG